MTVTCCARVARVVCWVAGCRLRRRWGRSCGRSPLGMRAGATGEKLLRADSAFWNNKLFARLEDAGWAYSISVRLQFWVRDAVQAISESAWRPLEDYPPDGEAQIAETTVKGRRLIVRRT